MVSKHSSGSSLRKSTRLLSRKRKDARKLSPKPEPRKRKDAREPSPTPEPRKREDARKLSPTPEPTDQLMVLNRPFVIYGLDNKQYLVQPQLYSADMRNPCAAADIDHEDLIRHVSGQDIHTRTDDDIGPPSGLEVPVTSSGSSNESSTHQDISKLELEGYTRGLQAAIALMKTQLPCIPGPNNTRNRKKRELRKQKIKARKIQRGSLGMK